MAYLAVEVVGRWLAVPEALDHRPAPSLEPDSQVALAFPYDVPSCLLRNHSGRKMSVAVPEMNVHMFT